MDVTEVATVDLAGMAAPYNPRKISARTINYVDDSIIFCINFFTINYGRRCISGIFSIIIVGLRFRGLGIFSC